jgi:hypothetical protein
MKCLTALTLVLGLSFPSSALAATVRTIFASQAQGSNSSPVMLEVSPGLGLNINLIPTEETIKKAWIDDPSRIALSFDSSLCQSFSEHQQECQSQGATVVHLRQIKPINFTALPRSATGVTLLTLVTQGAGGRKLYQFKLRPTTGEPKFTTLTIVPDPQKLTPIPEQTSSVTSSSQSQPLRSNSQEAANTKPTEVQSFTQSVPSGTTPPSRWQVVQSIPANPQTQSTATKPSPTATSTPSAIAPAPEPPSILPSPPTDKQIEQQASNSSSTTERPLARISVNTPKLPPERTSLKQTVATSPTPATTVSQQAISDINAIRAGLQVARNKKQINFGTTKWKQAQSALLWLSRGESRESAARKSGLPMPILTQLIRWGQQSP